MQLEQIVADVLQRAVVDGGVGQLADVQDAQAAAQRCASASLFAPLLLMPLPL